MNADKIPVNDNEEPPDNPIMFTDLCKALGVDEDIMLQRFAEILVRREESLS